MATKEDLERELNRSRGFIRAAETQLNKAIDAFNSLEEENPTTPPVEPPPPPPVEPPPPPPVTPPGQMIFRNRGDIPTQRHARWVGGVPDRWTLTNRLGTLAIVGDASSHTGGALQFRYPAGHPDGHEVGVAWTPGPGTSANEIYLGTIMKYSPGWRSHNNEVKLHLWAGASQWLGIFDGCWNGNVTQFKIAGRGLGTVPRPSNENCWHNNVAPCPPYVNDEWVKQELLIVRSTGSAQLWVNDILVAEHHGVDALRSYDFQEFQHAGTWGGGGGPVQAAQTWSVAETLIAWR